MAHFRVTGSIYEIKPAELIEALSIKGKSIKCKPRIFGYDLEWINENVELNINTLDEKEYSIQVDFAGKEENLIILLADLKDCLLETNTSFHIGYCEEDENGDPLSQEINYFSV